MNGALLLGLTYLFSGITAIFMAIYFLKINTNGLRSIIIHLFGAWSGHYIVVGAITLKSYLDKAEVLPLDTLRMVAAFFVLMQFIALCRLYFYIIKKHL